MQLNAGQLIQILFSTVITLLLILLLRMLKNGGSRIPAYTELKTSRAEEPGKGKICLENGKEIQKHGIELEHLIKDLEEEKEDRKLFRRDISTAIGNVHKELRKMNGAK